MTSKQYAVYSKSVFNLKTLWFLGFLGCLFFTNTTHAQYEIPSKPTKANPDAVYDYYNLLSSSEKAQLENKLIKYSDTTSTQIVVANTAIPSGDKPSGLKKRRFNVNNNGPKISPKRFRVVFRIG